MLVVVGWAQGQAYDASRPTAPAPAPSAMVAADAALPTWHFRVLADTGMALLDARFGRVFAGSPQWLSEAQVAALESQLGALSPRWLP